VPKTKASIRERRNLTFEEYLTRYRLLQHSVEKDQRSVGLLQGEAYRSFCHHFEHTKDPYLSVSILTKRNLEERVRRRRRLCERYAARIARAAERIADPELREYARFRYLYGLTHEQIADCSFYSVRTVYRHAGKAREAMKKSLLEISPKWKRIPPARFSVCGTLRQKDYRITSVCRSVATLTARRNKAGFCSRLIQHL